MSGNQEASIVFSHVLNKEGLASYLEQVQATTSAFDIHVLDLEADSLHSYREKVCLIQLNFGGHLAILDPLQGFDLGPLWSYLENKSLWFHGGDYDLAMLRRTYQWLPAIYRDTQIAARLCGARQFGLAALAEAWLGIKLNKAGQRADWGRRPLSEALLSYAVDDVRHVPGLVEKLLSRLGELGRMSWFEQACASALHSARNRPERSTEDAWRITGWGRLEHRELALLRALWEWREVQARMRDRPAFKVLNNDQMLQYVAKCHKAGEAPSPPKGVRGAAADSLKEAIETTLASDPAGWPPLKLRKRRPSGKWNEAAFDKLRSARDLAARQLDLEPALVASRSVLEEIAVKPESASEVLLPWQQEMLEASLLQQGKDGNGRQPPEESSGQALP